MGRSIGVLGACDTGGMTEALRVLLPNDRVEALSGPGGSPEERRAAFIALRDRFDLIVVNALQSLSDDILRLFPDGQLIHYPHLHVHAFHPDLTYVGRWQDGVVHGIGPSYHSSLCVWGYLHDLPPERTAALFCEEIFEALGYFDEWAPCMRELEAKFEACRLDFRRFLLRAKRSGPFMLSSDHPRIAAVIAQARCIASDRIGGEVRAVQDEVYVADHLAGLYWPLYPEIAAFYGARGRYDFSVDGHAMDLGAYVRHAYSRYDEQGLRQGSIVYSRDRARFDRVLGARS